MSICQIELAVSPLIKASAFLLPGSQPEDLKILNQTQMEKKQSARGDISSAQAVLLGALAPGVNGPTWNTLKTAFLMLGLCLAVMFGLAFSSSDSTLILHVAFLVLITITLFLLLDWWQLGLNLQLHHCPVLMPHSMQVIGCIGIWPLLQEQGFLNRLVWFLLNVKCKRWT
ncbi:Nuclear control of ATPase protein 2 [Theobroma cacao]|uniref:Nuclear control of ATPase protein 2 n=1 Tax=Theobroma cacao TaxID=3641 RepID=A0A061GGF7_THECC|nr:Nuclear control of ATPase protein 2 [Theobroma cacao]